MSRTDRHRPFWVQEADSLEQRFIWFDRGTPPWGWEKIFLYRDCNCRMYGCCGSWRHAENRNRRHSDQRRTREALKGNWLAWDQRGPR